MERVAWRRWTCRSIKGGVMSFDSLHCWRRRCFSVSRLSLQPDVPKGSKPVVLQPGFKELFVKNLYFNSSIAVIIFGGWLFYKGYKWMAGLSISSFFKIGFTAGFCTAVAAGVVAVVVARGIRINPDQVTRHVLDLLQNDSLVKARMAGSPTLGNFSVSNSSGGIFSGVQSIQELNPVKLLSAPARRLQMMCEVTGESGESALVSVDVLKPKTFSHALRYKSITVDFPNGDRHILAGTETDVLYKGPRARFH
eukprot:EG_transcript_18464